MAVGTHFVNFSILLESSKIITGDNNYPLVFLEVTASLHSFSRSCLPNTQVSEPLGVSQAFLSKVAFHVPFACAMKWFSSTYNPTGETEMPYTYSSLSKY